MAEENGNQDKDPKRPSLGEMFKKMDEKGKKGAKPIEEDQPGETVTDVPDISGGITDDSFSERRTREAENTPESGDSGLLYDNLDNLNLDEEPNPAEPLPQEIVPEQPSEAGMQPPSQEGFPEDFYEDDTPPQASSQIPRSAFGSAIRHPAVTMLGAGVIAFLLLQASNFMANWYTSSKKKDKTEASIPAEDSDLEGISAELKKLGAKFDINESNNRRKYISMIESNKKLEAKVSDLEQLKTNPETAPMKEMEDYQKEIMISNKRMMDAYRKELQNRVNAALKSIKNTGGSVQVRPIETTEPIKPVEPKEKPNDKPEYDPITQYNDLMEMTTKDEIITSYELAQATSNCRHILGLLQKNHPVYGKFARNSETIRTLEQTANKYLNFANQVLLENETVQHNEKYKKVELRINIDALKNGAEKSKSTGWMDLEISLSDFFKIDSNVYLALIVNYGNPVSVLKQGKAAEEFVYKLLENAKIFDSGKAFTADAIKNAKVKGLALRLTSPDGAELTAKNLQDYLKQDRGD